jgi:phage repressor protein C with HTH and peptisase S24 domain
MNRSENDLLAEKIAAAIKKSGIESQEIANRVGVSKQAVTGWITTGRIGKPTLQKFANVVGAPLEYFFAAQNEDTISPAILLPDGKYTSVVVLNNSDPDYREIRKVKLQLSAGITGFIADPEEDDGKPIGFRQSWFDENGFVPEKLIAIKVKGDSMEPRVSQGDTVVVNTADITPKDGEAFAVNYEGESVVKRLVRDAGSWWLSSDNPDQRRYPPKKCDENCIIIGRIVQQQRARI